MRVKRYTYQAGEARDIDKYPDGVEYMLMLIDIGEWDFLELYAEVGCSDNYSEGESYEHLKEAIIELASDNGFDLSCYDFETEV